MRNFIASCYFKLADASKLGRVFQNLIGNALKFIQGETPQVQISAAHVDHEWRVWVRDNGIGIPSQDCNRIFLMFERLHSSSEYVGTGLGLAICRKIVERHGGRIWVEPSPAVARRFISPFPIENHPRPGHRSH